MAEFVGRSEEYQVTQYGPTCGENHPLFGRNPTTPVPADDAGKTAAW